jgi:hypothetical protein
MIDPVRRTILRELQAMEREIAAYPDDETPWIMVPGVPNSGGTLALHCAGNLRHFIGTVLGGTGYVRDRDAEFTQRDLPRAAAIAELQAASHDVDRTLRRLPPAALASPYPEPSADGPMDTGMMLVHLATHLAYHLGQVDLHRRVVTGDASGVGAVSRGMLPSPSA